MATLNPNLGLAPCCIAALLRGPEPDQVWHRFALAQALAAT